MMNKGQLAGLMKQAQQMQDNMRKMQEQLALIEVEGQAGSGAVKVVMTCKHEVKRVAIDPSVMGEALAGYERTRDQLSLPLLHATDRLASFDWSMDELRLVLLEMSDAMRHELKFLRHEVANAESRAA